MFEFQACATFTIWRQAEDETCTHPFVLARELGGGDVCTRTEPMHFTAWLQTLDAHVLVVEPEDEVIVPPASVATSQSCVHQPRRPSGVVRAA
ncbi:MAG: hypothetical protein JWQ21_2675 [Herminiimonas sp.]|nr:hypothetical protein [Herminiimonas sp.]